MSSLSPKDRVSLCLFSFADGRRCRTPRTGNHPHFCFYHAQKEARSQTAEALAKDLASFFSGDYLSACDLTAALGRLIPAVLRGDIKPRLARTVAYMVQTLIQTIHLAQNEYSNAFGPDGWRKAVRNSVQTNFDYRFPPEPQPEQSAHQATHGPTQAPKPAPAPQPSAPEAPPQSTPVSSPSRSIRPIHPAPLITPTNPHNLSGINACNTSRNQLIIKGLRES